MIHHLPDESLGMWVHWDLVHEHIPKDRDDHRQISAERRLEQDLWKMLEREEII